MSFNFKEEMEREENIRGYNKSIEWRNQSICFTLMELRNTDEYEKAVEKLDKIIAELAELDNQLTGKAGWK